MEYLVLGVLLGVLAASFLGAGAGINHSLEARAYRKRVCSISSSSDHRAEAARLIRESFHTNNPEFGKYLRNEAYVHFRNADMIDNGPYKY